MARKAKKLPKLEVGNVLDEAYNGEDRLLFTDFSIDSEEDLRYLREIEVRYALVVDLHGNPTDETVYRDKVDSDEDEQPDGK